MEPGLALPENRLPGWITIRRVRREPRGRKVLAVPQRSFRFVCTMCGGVGDARPTPSAAVAKAVDHVRLCDASGPLGPREWRGTNPRVSLTLQSHYQRMEEYLRVSPQFNPPAPSETIWQALRRRSGAWPRQVNEIVRGPFKRMWADLATLISARTRRG